MAQEMVAGALVSILIETLIEYAKSAVICNRVCKALQVELELIRPDVKRIEQQMVRRMQSNAEPLDIVERWLARLKEKLREAEVEVTACKSGGKIRRLNAFENAHLTKKIQGLTEDIRKLAGDDVSRAVLSSTISNGSIHGRGSGGRGRGAVRGRGSGRGRGPGLGRGSGHGNGSSHGSSSSGSYESPDSSGHGPAHQASLDLDRWRMDVASIRQAEEETRSSIDRPHSVDFTQPVVVEQPIAYVQYVQPPVAVQYHIPPAPHHGWAQHPSGYYWP